MYKKSSKNRSNSHSKPIIVKLSNPVSDTICPSCSTKVSVEIPLLPSLKLDTYGSRGNVGPERIGDILRQENDFGLGKSSARTIFSNTSGTKVVTDKMDPNDLCPFPSIELTGVGSLESSFGSVSTDEIIHLLPMKSSFVSSKEVSHSGFRAKKDKYLNMRIKDEVKIDLKHETTESLTSLLSFKRNSHNKICPIEEVTESSCSSSCSKESKRVLKVREEQERIEQISRIIANAITKARDRPATRRGWVGEENW